MTLPVNITIGEYVPPDPPHYLGWRGLHKSEGGRITPEGQPCVLPSDMAPAIPFNAEMQRLAWALMKRYNPTLILPGNFRAPYAGDTAFTNGTGWDNAKQPDEIYADYVNMMDIGAMLPRLQKAITCAGSFSGGAKVGTEIVCTPGIDGIDSNKPMPSVEEVVRRGWITFAVIGWTAADKSWRIGHFGTRGVVALPRFLRVVTSYPAAWFTPWQADTLPDPLRIYL